jgi:rhamnulokinase
MRHWATRDLAALLDEAAGLAPGPTVDVDDEAFIAPGDMPARIAAAVGCEMTRGETVRCVLDSLAAGYRSAVDRAAGLAGRQVDVVHVVGGGSQNELLCQLTADAVGRPVVAGPVEATALGNVLVQARAHGALTGDLDDLRRVVVDSVELRRYEPA